MTYAETLLEQAEHLATLDTKRPRKANLKRAISSAYYALFHCLVDSAVRRVVSGRGQEKDRLRALLSRTFGHNEMKRVAKSFSGGTPIRAVSDVLGERAQIPEKLQSVAGTFVDLQEVRHKADYDIFYEPSRQETFDIIARAKKSIVEWNEIQKQTATDTFLVCLLTYDKIRKR